MTRLKMRLAPTLPHSGASFAANHNTKGPDFADINNFASSQMIDTGIRIFFAQLTTSKTKGKKSIKKARKIIKRKQRHPIYRRSELKLSEGP